MGFTSVRTMKLQEKVYTTLFPCLSLMIFFFLLKIWLNTRLAKGFNVEHILFQVTDNNIIKHNNKSVVFPLKLKRSKDFHFRDQLQSGSKSGRTSHCSVSQTVITPAVKTYSHINLMMKLLIRAWPNTLWSSHSCPCSVFVLTW